MSVDNRFVHIDYWPEHQYGQCYVDPSNSFYWINIPKNASTTIKLTMDNWYQSNFILDHNFPQKLTPIICLRHPIDRWISGFVEYLFRDQSEKIGKCSIEEISDSLKSRPFRELIFNKIIFDEHTEKQQYFIHGLDLSTAIYFLINKKFTATFNHFLTTQIKQSAIISYSGYTTADSHFKQKLTHLIKEILNKNLRFIDNIRREYECDFKLIQQAKFYVP